MRIGILGGTFDPPHTGHLALAQAAIDHLDLDEVLFIPANKNPLKSHAAEAPAKHRLAMVDLLLAGRPKMGYSDVEIARGGVSYAVDTISALQMAQPGDYWFIMGADSLKSIQDWKNPARLLKLCRLAVAIRPPLIVADVILKVPSDFKDRVDVISMPPLHVSSTELRARLRNHETPGPMMTPQVLQYIESHHLYPNA